MKAKAASLGLAIVGIVLLSVASIFIFRSIDKLGRLEGRTGSEIVMNELFASLRDHDDFGSAIEATEGLKRDVLGLGLYDAQGGKVYSWGKVPASYSAPAAPGQEGRSPVRSYLENPSNASFILLLRPFSFVPPPPRGPRPGSLEPPPGPPPSEHAFLFTTLKSAEVVYLEIRQSAYWAGHRLRTVLFPIVEILLGALVFFIRALVLRNRDYRRRIEDQRSLVVLGTAASTLAHEIKNPLLSIRLQSSILERVCPEEGRRELDIINGEVDRLSALSYRVNDWLRDPRGRPGVFEASGLLREISVRLLGSDRVKAEVGIAYPVTIDPERLSSVMENLLRNALESGGPDEGIQIELEAEEGKTVIGILDRGQGIPEENLERVFDPFFTTKSRGSGIGLAICRRFVEAAGGTITLAARRGGGTQARLSLPRPALDKSGTTKDEQ